MPVRARTRVRPGRPHALLLRLRTLLRRPWLDRDIARGETRIADAGLALREAQLAGWHERGRLACRLEGILVTGELPPLRSSVAPVDPVAVSVARPVLVELILSLRSAEAVTARGVVLGWRLLTDPGSPFYALGGSDDPDRLWRELLVVLLALRPSVLRGGPMVDLARADPRLMWVTAGS